MKNIQFLKLIVVKRQLLRYYNYFEKKSNSCMLEEKPNFNFFYEKTQFLALNEIHIINR